MRETDKNNKKGTSIRRAVRWSRSRKSKKKCSEVPTGAQIATGSYVLCLALFVVFNNSVALLQFRSEFETQRKIEMSVPHISSAVLRHDLAHLCPDEQRA